MSRFESSLATRADDAELRRVMSQTAMTGNISLSFGREPSYFDAATVEGDQVQTGILREKSTQRIVGMASRAVSACYVNGEIVDIGYISALRIVPEFRARAGLLARGYRMFRDMHGDGRVPYYLTTIAEDNRNALALLTSQRAGLPVYHPLGRFHTLTFAATNRNGKAAGNGISVRPATIGDGPRVDRFLCEEGPRRQFFPAYAATEFFASPCRLRGLWPDSVLLASNDKSELVGTFGVWDQRPFRQCVVSGYDRWLAVGRPFYNAIANVRGKPKLPNVGTPLNLRFTAIPVVAGNDADIAKQLLCAAVNFAAKQNAAMLTMGLHECDPLLPIARLYAGREYTTLLYLVHWQDERPDYDQLSRRVPYLELGCL